jgi:hypothetical protein
MNSYANYVLVERCCKVCGELFEVERRRGGQRIYCPRCSPPGTQVVKVRGRYKFRRRPPAFRRIDAVAWLANPSMWDESA